MSALHSFLLGRGPAGLLPDIGILVLRFGFGFSMALQHGRATLAGFRSNPGAFPNPLGLGHELSMALMVFAELFCALAVSLGLLTRLALVPLTIGLGTAYFVYHGDDAFGDKELAYLYLTTWVVLLLTGPGRFSIDRLLFTRFHRRSLGAIVAVVLCAALPSPAGAATTLESDLPRRDDLPLEQHPGLDTVYGTLEASDDVRLRTVLTRPVGTAGRLPAVLYVQWLSCDTIELAADSTDGWSQMLRRVALESGMVMLRTEKAGVGDSEGPPCSELGYDQELEHHRDALVWLLRHPWVDPERVVIYGASMGATWAPLVAAGHDVAGIVVWGGGAKTWLERTLGFERRFRELSQVPPEQLTAEIKLISALLPEYLIERRTPQQIAQSDPELGAAWDLMVGTDGVTHYGRSLRFHQEAQGRDWAAAWAAIEAPVLVLYGEYDWYEDEPGHQLIADLVNRSAPGRARLEVFPGVDHHFVRFPDPRSAVSGEGGTVAEGPIVDEILAWLSAVTAAEPRAVRDNTSPTLDAYRRGEALVRRALEDLGGLERLEAAGGLTVEGSGALDLTTLMQGAHPERPDRVAVEEWFAVDLAGGRVGYEIHGKVNPDADEWIRYVYDDAGRMLIVLRRSREAFWVPGDDDHRRRYQRIVPQLLLREALARRATLRALGLRPTGSPGGSQTASFTLETGEAITLLFDPDSSRLDGFEYLLDVPLRGDTAIQWIFDSYRDVEGLGPYPTGHRIFQGDRLLKEVRYKVVRAGIDQAAVLRAPEGVTIPDPPPPPEPPTQTDSTADAEPATDSSANSLAEPTDLPEVRTLANGVHVAVNVREGFHVLFVELGDSVVVVDAPAGYHELQMVPAIDWAGDVTSSSVGRRLLAAIRATVPGKPVDHVVLTHHHGDHIGGIRPFLAAGATVYASAPTARTVERAAQATFRLEPDELSGREIDPKIEIVDGERVLSGGGRTARIIDVGDNPHAEGMLLVYLPNERILFQSDLFMPSGGAFPEPARVPIMRWFVDWLDASALDPETLLAIHGSGRVTAEQLETIRSLGR